MKILVHSVTPYARSAYGAITRYICSWLKERGHEILIGTKHWMPNGPGFNWKGSPVLMGTNHTIINELVFTEKIDWVISIEDIWGFKEDQSGFERWVCYCPIDTEFVSPKIIEILKGKPVPRLVLAMSKHGKRELNKHKIDATYVPVGFDPVIFRPGWDNLHKNPGDELKEMCGWTDDNIIFGSLGVNYGTDRKGFVSLLRAFKEFYNRHNEARLYLHTQLMWHQGVPLKNIIDNLGLGFIVFAPNQTDYEFGVISEMEVAQAYNMMDVFILPTHGEGFGMPIIEAQACGVPVIVTNSTTGPELVKGGWLIPVDDDDYNWSAAGTWHLEPRVSNIVETMEKAYQLWKKGKLKEVGQKAHRAVMKQYTWEKVLKTYWEPIEKRLQAMS